MHRSALSGEILKQIDKVTVERFTSCFESNQIHPSELIVLRRFLKPICIRLSIEFTELTPLELNRLARSEWIAVCKGWITWSSPLMDVDENQHHIEAPNREIEHVNPLIYLFEESVECLLDQEREIYEKAVDRTRLLATLYVQLHQNRLFSESLNDSRF
jgi:hypothetical protein